MKRFKTQLFYITTIFLITLPWYSNASQCNERDWNRALVSQQSLERKYNLLASRYNEWLGSFQQSIFLHIEFSRQELTYLWQKNSNNFQQKIEKQLLFALESRQQVNDLIQYLETIPSQVQTQQAVWDKIGQDCTNDKLITNSVAALHYRSFDDSLLLDLSNLKQQLTTMNRYYDREIITLQSINEPTLP
ncbi:MAG: hypothetical protein ACK5MF_06870 [Vibrio sp.]|uniref:hypothetical protein n=1 Tax=Vibrio sp. TaxID=678 RepID=UPI003A884859